MFRTKTLKKKISDHKFLYRTVMGKELNLDDPKDFNEKINWLIIYKYGKKEGKLADKILVKDYVANLKVEGLKIPKTIKTYNKSSKIDLTELPSKFVLKCNHYSGDVFICKDKKSFDLDGCKRRLGEVLKNDFSRINYEYHYSYIKPQIMAEEYLYDGKHKNPVDYKIYCFNGKPESILLCSNREKKLLLNDFDFNWKQLDYTTKEYRSNEKFKKPKNLKKMYEIAKELSVGLPFVRVDLYEIGDEVYFGELTFTPGAGIIKYYKQDALDYLGSKIDLSLF